MKKWKANFRMYKAFFGGYFKYRDKIKKMDSWINKYAKVKNLSVNPHAMYLTNLKIWLAENEEMYGARICPCFEATGEKKIDQQLVCPCTYAEHDIKEQGTCHCSLFGKADLTEDDWKKAEQRVMKEYRIPLKISNNTVETRGVPIEPYRNMDVPDAMHQFKQALNQIESYPFYMKVNSEQSAKNILSYSKLRNLNASYEQKSDHYLVTIKK